jgi:hypothetical protein
MSIHPSSVKGGQDLVSLPLHSCSARLPVCKLLSNIRFCILSAAVMRPSVVLFLVAVTVLLLAATQTEAVPFVETGQDALSDSESVAGSDTRRSRVRRAFWCSALCLAKGRTNGGTCLPRSDNRDSETCGRGYVCVCD